MGDVRILLNTALKKDEWGAVPHWFSHPSSLLVMEDALLFKAQVVVTTEDRRQRHSILYRK